MKSCTVDDLKKAISDHDENVHFIDVRSVGEFEKSHIEGFINIPLGSDTKAFEKFKGTTVYLICFSGGRSDMACQALDGVGFKEVLSVKGGLLVWKVKGYPVVGG